MRVTSADTAQISPGATVTERRSGFSQSEGIRIAWESRGDGPYRFVLVPFLGVFGRSALSIFPGLRATLGALTREGRVTVFDPRGTGQSSPGPIKPTVADLAEDLQNVILQSESRPAWLIAHFDASGPAIHLATRRPDLVAGILFDTGMARFAADDGYPEGVQHADYARLEEEIASDPLQGLATILTSAYSLPPIVAPSIAERSAGELDLERRRRLVSFFLTFDVRADITRCIVPCFVAHGENASLLPVSASRFLATNLANSEFKPIEGRGDFLLQNAGREWFPSAIRFIRRKSSAR